MNTETIILTNKGKGFSEALDLTEKYALSKSLTKKQSLHLRLLAEETVGMMHALTGEREAQFWIDEEDGSIRIHLKVKADMNSKMRKNLLDASTTGTNAAAKGVMGRIRDIFERLLEPSDDNDFSRAYATEFSYARGDADAMAAATVGLWSLNKYKEEIKKQNAPAENWDELEKSVVAKLASEVEIAIVDRTVEMIIYKKF